MKSLLDVNEPEDGYESRDKIPIFLVNEQVCPFQVNVTNRTTLVDLSNYMPNGEWQLMGVPTITR